MFSRVPPRVKKLLSLLLKLGLTTVAIWLVSQKVDWRQAWQQLVAAQWGWLVPALALLVFSKAVSGYRQQVWLHCVGVHLSLAQSVRLYFVGMFYSLFLPGGVSGDGYKVVVLQRHFGAGYRLLVSATLLDRGAGVAALLSLSAVGVLLMAVGPYSLPSQAGWVSVAAFAAIGIGFFAVLWLFFRRFWSGGTPALVASLGVQLGQVAASWFLLLALGVTTDHLAYLTLFLASSLATVVPLTVGGIGARELAFVYAGEWLGINLELAVVFSLLFFLLTVVSSLPGAFIRTGLTGQQEQAAPK